MLVAPPLSDRAHVPTDADVVQVLRGASALWNELIASIRSSRDVQFEWKHYGKSAGWTLRLLQQKRTLLYLVPADGSFDAVFVFGRKAVDIAEQSDLPASIIESIRSAKPYVEGRSFRVPVRQPVDIATIHRLVEIKLAS